MTDTANAPEHSKMRRMIYENRSHLAPQCVWLAYSEAAEGGDLCLEDEFLSEEDFADLQHKPPKYVLATHCDELVAAAYLDAIEIIRMLPELILMNADQVRAIEKAGNVLSRSGARTNARAALTAYGERMKAEGAEAADEEAFARGANWAQEKARVEGRLVIVDSPELATLRADLAEAQAKIARLTMISNELSWSKKTRDISNRLFAALQENANG